MADYELAVCDFGMSEMQLTELEKVPGLTILHIDALISEPWLGKTLLDQFIKHRINEIDIIMWIDADAFFNSTIPNVYPILEGYDLLIDAHVQSVSEITDEKTIDDLGLRASDSYFSSGFWIIRPNGFFKKYEQLGRLVYGRSFWEQDAFVAAIYMERLKIRTINGSIWHCRGKTSLSTCTVDGLTAFYNQEPIYVIHANDHYRIRKDGRRVLYRPVLAKLQLYYENIYNERMGFKKIVVNKLSYYAFYLLFLIKNSTIVFKRAIIKITKAIGIYDTIVKIYKSAKNKK
ncbi:hypothetical protein [Spirosoma sp. 48-14]|nr:hypothetical protein [Spirosoma sp. 48-14]